MKNILTILLLSFSLTADAQFAYEFGLNMSKMAIKVKDKDFATQYKPGAALGILGDIRLDGKIFFQPGLFVKMAGTKITEPKGEYSVNTIDLQLNIEYKTGERCGSRFFFGGGPNICYNTSGSYYYGGQSADLVIGPTRSDNFKKRGLGLGLNIGYLPKKHYYIRAHYLAGLSNLKPVGDSKNVLKASGVGIKIGYFFGNCKQKGNTYGFSREKINHWRGLSKGKYSRRTRTPY